MSRGGRRSWGLLAWVALVLLVACGGDGAADPGTATEGASAAETPAQVIDGILTPPAGASEPTATLEPDAPTPTRPPRPEPTPTRELVQHVRLSPEQLALYQPNELGQIPILMYHHIDDEPADYTRSPAQLRADLQWLYDHNFYVVSLEDVITNQIDIPAGKRPVVLTFDDSPASQFDLTPLATGQLAIAPDSAVGILEEFFSTHPDFGRGGHFAVVPWKIFNWHPAEDRRDQNDYSNAKLQWLADNGYELGNHTFDHVGLADLSDEEIKQQLAEATDFVRAIVPESAMDIVTLPYGMYPHGSDASLLRGFEYEGRWYHFAAALMVGANPAFSPLSTAFDPYALARIQTNEAQLEHWFQVFEEQPGILYVSDGDPTACTVPLDLHSSLAGTFDETKCGERDVVRY